MVTKILSSQQILRALRVAFVASLALAFQAGWAQNDPQAPSTTQSITNLSAQIDAIEEQIAATGTITPQQQTQLNTLRNQLNNAIRNLNTIRQQEAQLLNDLRMNDSESQVDTLKQQADEALARAEASGSAADKLAAAEASAKAADAMAKAGQTQNASNYAEKAASLVSDPQVIASNPAAAARVIQQAATVASDPNVAAANPGNAAKVAIAATFVVNTPEVKNSTDSSVSGAVREISQKVTTITANPAVTNAPVNVNLQTNLNQAQTAATSGSAIVVSGPPTIVTSGSPITPIDVGIISRSTTG